MIELLLLSLLLPPPPPHPPPPPGPDVDTVSCGIAPGAQLGSGIVEFGDITQTEILETVHVLVPSDTLYPHVADPTNQTGGI